MRENWNICGLKDKKKIVEFMTMCKIPVMGIADCRRKEKFIPTFIWSGVEQDWRTKQLKVSSYTQTQQRTSQKQYTPQRGSSGSEKKELLITSMCMYHVTTCIQMRKWIAFSSNSWTAFAKFQMKRK